MKCKKSSSQKAGQACMGETQGEDSMRSQDSDIQMVAHGTVTPIKGDSSPVSFSPLTKDKAYPVVFRINHVETYGEPSVLSALQGLKQDILELHDDFLDERVSEGTIIELIDKWFPILSEGEKKGDDE